MWEGPVLEGKQSYRTGRDHHGGEKTELWAPGTDTGG